MNLVRAIFRAVDSAGTLSAPAERFFDFGGAFGASSDAGIRVTRETALTYAAIWRAVNLISRDVAKLPVCVYRRTATGKERATGHPAFGLLRRTSPDGLTPFSIKQVLMSHCLVEGNGYAHIKRNGSNTPEALLPLSPDLTTPVRLENGKIGYRTTIPTNGEHRTLRSDEVLHIRGLGFDGLQGYSVIQFAANSIGLGLAAAKYGSVFFKRNGRPSIVLEHPGKLTKDARQGIREEWADMHQGIENSHRPALLQEGMKVSPIGINAKDAQLIESRQFEIREIANWFGVPAHKLGDPTRTSFSSLEQENQSYLDEALDAWLVNWEQELTAKLLGHDTQKRDSHFIEFNRLALVRADMSTRFQAYNAAIQSGWMSRDEVRDRENMNAIPDGAGEEFLVPLNMGPAGQDTPAADPGDTLPVDDNQDGKASDMPVSVQIRLITESCGRACARLSHQARKAAKKPGCFVRWVESLADEHATAIYEMLAAPIQAVDADAKVESHVEALLDRYRDVMLEAAECPASELAEGVMFRSSIFESSYPQRLADRIVGGSDNG